MFYDPFRSFLIKDKVKKVIKSYQYYCLIWKAEEGLEKIKSQGYWYGYFDRYSLSSVKTL